MSIGVFVCDTGAKLSTACLGFSGWFGGNGLMIHHGQLNYTL